MNGRRSDASTSTDDLKDRPLCLFYFTHPFGVLSPEPPTVAAAPAHVARAFINMEPVSPLHFFSPSADSYDTRTTTSTDKLSFDLGNTQVHKNPVNLVSVSKARKCTIDLGIPRDTMSSSLLSSDIWFSSGSSSRSYEYTRRLIPYNRILPPLQLPAPQDTSTADSSDDLWPIKCINPARFSLPPIKMPKIKVTKARTRVNSERADEVSSVESVSVKEVKCRKIVGVKKHRKRTHAAQLSGVRRMLTRLMQRAVKGSVIIPSYSDSVYYKMGYVLDNCPTLHMCCSSVPLRVAVMLIAVLGLGWAALCAFAFSSGGRVLIEQHGVPSGVASALRLIHGIYGVLLCAVHILLFFAPLFKSDLFCEVYIWFMIVFWIFLILTAVGTAIASIVAQKVLFGCVYLAVALVTVLISVYFTIIVANYRMTLP